MKHCVLDKRISLKAKALYQLIDMLGDGATVEQIAEICTDGVTSISSGLKELEAAGYLIRERIRDKGRIIGIRYALKGRE